MLIVLTFYLRSQSTGALELKLVISLLFLLLVILQIQLWFGGHGVLKLNALEQAIETQVEINQQLAERNRQLNAEVIELKQGREALEDRARSQLGLIKQGEMFYRIIPPAESSD